jgi:hypothetical protein
MHDKKEVVDLGQSPRLVEDKFTGLRHALQCEPRVVTETEPVAQPLAT